MSQRPIMTVGRLAQLYVAVAVAACSSGAPLPEPESVRVREGVCEHIDNSWECARAVEAALMSDNPRLGVGRSGDTLMLPLLDGTRVAVVDTTTDEGTRYNLIGAVTERFWLLQGQLYEGGFNLLVDRAGGARYTVWNSPLPSPSGRLLFVSSVDLEAGYNPNGIQIFRVLPDALVREGEFLLADWGAVGARWVGETVVEYDRVQLCAPPAEQGMCRTPGRARAEGLGWVLEGRP